MKIYDKFANWLCSFMPDKYVHFIAGSTIALLFAALFYVTTAGATAAAAGAGGALTALGLGAIKEVIDFFRNKTFDVSDIVATTLGGIYGFLIYVIIL